MLANEQKEKLNNKPPYPHSQQTHQEEINP